MEVPQLPIELVRDIVLLTDGRTFVSCLLAGKAIYDSFRRDELAMIKTRYTNSVNMGRIIRCHEGRAGVVIDKCLMKKDTKMYIGTFKDMFDDECQSAVFAAGEWTIVDYYNHQYYYYGYHKDCNMEQEMTLEWTSKQCDCQYGIATKREFDVIVSDIYDMCEQEWENDGADVLTFDEWFEDFQLSDYRDIFLDDDDFFFISSGRGDTDFSTYIARNNDGKVIAFWMMADSDRICDNLVSC